MQIIISTTDCEQHARAIILFFVIIIIIIIIINNDDDKRTKLTTLSFVVLFLVQKSLDSVQVSDGTYCNVLFFLEYTIVAIVA